jgi:Icc-related predicted phosphoesterase
MFSNCIYLENSAVELFGYKIWGSPITPTFYNWAFNADRGEEIKKYRDLIPEGTDILITHGQPYGILDKTFGKLSVWCQDLLNAVIKIKPKYHIFGHIHESNGRVKLYETEFINAPICNLSYKHYNKFYTFELEDKSV